MDFRNVLLLHLHPDFLGQAEVSEQALEIGKWENLSGLHPLTKQVSILVAGFSRSRVIPRLSLSFESVLNNRTCCTQDNMTCKKCRLSIFASISCKSAGFSVLDYLGVSLTPHLILIYTR